MSTDDPSVLPPGLPAPVDDGAADHLPGMHLPETALPSTDGSDQLVDEVGSRERTVVYVYPRMSQPGEPKLTEDWDLIPGARGCTPEACGFRDHHAELAAAGADVVGLSTQDPTSQREAVERLHLPFPLLSDARLELTRALRLPIFRVADQVLLKRLTLVIRHARIEHVFYPVFPPDAHAGEVLTWLENHPPSGPS